MNAPLSGDGFRAFRDLDAERAEARLRERQAADGPTRLTVCALGLAARDVGRLRQRAASNADRQPVIEWCSSELAHAADVLLIDRRDPATEAWVSREHAWLAQRAVVWIGGPALAPQQPMLDLPLDPRRLSRRLLDAFRARPAPRRALVTRVLQPAAPAFLVLAGASAPRWRWSSWLEASGRRATVTDRAREGLAALHAAPYAGLILCDEVPDLDAGALARRVRALEPRVGRLPLLWLTDAGDTWTRWRARLAGFDTVAPVPRSPEGLAALLDRLPAPRPATQPMSGLQDAQVEPAGG